MRVELHCHSTCSDGSESPSAVAERARAAGCGLFCLTDHDTCAGYPATRDIDRGEMRVLRGVELTCSEDAHTVHLLVYDVAGDGRWHELEQVLAQQADARRARVFAIADRLGALGARLDPEAVIADAAAGVVGRPHIARALVAAGVVSSISEAFARFLGDGGAADVPLSRLSVSRALALARNVGAVVSLAHPHTLGARAEALIRRYRRAGLDAIEAFYGSYNARQRRRWTRLARDQDLVVTGGSDSHGAHSPQIAELGVELPGSRVERLLRWLGC